MARTERTPAVEVLWSLYAQGNVDTETLLRAAGMDVDNIDLESVTVSIDRLSGTVTVTYDLG